MVQQKRFLDRALSVSHVSVTFESQSWVSQWTTSASCAWVWSAWALAGLLTACPPCLVECLQKLAVNIPEHDSHSAYFGLPKCGPVRKGMFPFFLPNFPCNLSHCQKKKVPARANSENQISQADRGAETAWWNTEIRCLPLPCCKVFHISTSRQLGLL